MGIFLLSTITSTLLTTLVNNDPGPKGVLTHISTFDKISIGKAHALLYSSDM